MYANRRSGNMAVLYMRNASGRNYRNSSFTVDVVMGNIPRSTERMSSFFFFLLLYDWLLMSYKHGFYCKDR